MPVVSAFLTAGSPLPLLRPDNPPWAPIHAAYQAAGKALAASKPDVIALYSTQWIAVLDALWQTRPNSAGMHVDENWHEFGDLHYDIKADLELSAAVIESTPAFGVRSKPVDYDAFPVDTGTIVANHYLNQSNIPLVIAANNLYHDWEITGKLAESVVTEADKLGRRVAFVGVGGLSGTIFREEIDIATDHIASPEDDQWNQKMLGLLEQGDMDAIRATAPEYAGAARVDMGFKHLAWILAGLGGSFKDATVHGYGPSYGSGAAVVEFNL